VHRGESGFVTGFLLRTFLVFALLGLAVEEVGQIVVTQIHASNAAGAAAQAGADKWVATHNVNLAEQAAIDAMAAEDSGAAMTAFSVADDGSVTVTVKEEAPTLVVKHVSFLKQFGIQHATEHEIHSLA
jgi:hypothetical protein